ncbi:hypothetical protein LX64_00471 [Chitinophaga skermanii]|uniref:Uncharacterized protein n=1 Tax=Chitinophaga skermanii TaxID=331697 RepID=A0A327R526_9BACT|nr:hypothetical protein [Chitinophaga skermanii]RAJ10864.1 hypothetical protein LX64_00471 [Chitinophaga skermanii]
MKKLIFAIACLAIGFTANAADSKTSTPAEKKVEVKTTTANIKVGANKFEKKDFYRIQRMFTINDLCGNHVNVWVSAPNGTSFITMYDAALDHVVGCLNSNGCYQ